MIAVPIPVLIAGEIAWIGLGRVDDDASFARPHRGENLAVPETTRSQPMMRSAPPAPTPIAWICSGRDAILIWL